MTNSLTTLSVSELVAAERATHAAAHELFMEVTGGGEFVPSAAVRRQVNRLQGKWEAVLGEFERRDLMVPVA